jgi:MinD-like ATPase involved in chromosome partitioning or flagellar assembly
MADFVIVDTPAHFTEHVLTALDAAHLHILVTTPEVPALKNVRVALDTLDLLNMPIDRRLVVLNRCDARVGLTESDVERVLQVPPSVLVPSSRDVPICINRGEPIVTAKPKHPVSKAIRGLATGPIAALASTPAPDGRPAASGGRPAVVARVPVQPVAGFGSDGRSSVVPDGVGRSSVAPGAVGRPSGPSGPGPQALAGADQ